MKRSLLKIDHRALRDNIDKQPFTIQHNLSAHSGFSLGHLVDLARSLPPESVEYNAGNLPVSMDPATTPLTGLSVEETVRRIEDCNSWMVLKNVERVPAYRSMLDDCLDEVQQVSEAVFPGMKTRQGYIFISSPESVTPFHFDQEFNFLLQVRGNKTVHVFPRTTISQKEIEERFATHPRNLIYQEDYGRAATSFVLQPGAGLHVPIAAPHWVKNGENVSISFSITFQTASSERRSQMYRFNAHLRSLGMHPFPIGRSPLRDTVKLYCFLGARMAMSRVKGFLPIPLSGGPHSRQGAGA